MMRPIASTLIALHLSIGGVPAFGQTTMPATTRPTTAPATRPALDPLRAGWDAPPDATKPHVYWYWLNGVVTKAGITRDLEAMARNGIGGAYIGHIGFGPESDTPQSATAEPLSDAWYELMQHAIREGLRTGVTIGLFNGPGWSQSGGPWVRPEESMTYLDSVEVRHAGPGRFDAVLPRAKGAIADVRVIAFPAPAADGERVKVLSATSDDAAVDGLPDGKPIVLPADKSYLPLRVTLEVAPGSVVRSVEFDHRSGVQAKGVLFTSADGVTFERLRDFTLDRRTGPKVILHARSSVVSVPPTAARFFRVEIPWNTRPAQNDATLGIRLGAGARLEMAAEKQLGVASKSITPPWDAFMWPATPEPDAASTVPAGRVIDLTSTLAADGRLTWDAPPGAWVVQRLSTVSTGAGNGPTPPKMRGLEVDKMSRAAAERYLRVGPVGQLWDRLAAAERAGFTRVIVDSYEKGLQNWTPGLEAIFAERYGYDPVPWLPVLSGRVVDTAERSDRFLWDLRRLVADLMAENYVSGFRDTLRSWGLNLWIENYGHFGFPAEMLSYGGAADAIGGEFWSNKPISRMENRGAASAAHVYGKPLVSSEAFTSAGSLDESPGNLKARGDLAFIDGINHYVLHVVTHQPSDLPGPGLALLWGTYFDRNALWFAAEGRSWVEYVRRTCSMLQQGRAVADVAYFIGEDTPQMTGRLTPALPPGYDHDLINAEVLTRDATVVDGRLTLPGGGSYAVLVVPPLDNMRPALLERIAALVNDGLTLVGPPPRRSPSLQGQPAADERVSELAATLWPAEGVAERRVGRGRVLRDADLGALLGGMNVGPAIVESNPFVLWKHRATPDAEIFFLSNQTNRTVRIAPSFRATGRAPERWDAETGRVEPIATYREADGRTIVPLTLGPSQSAFVVFRAGAVRQPAVVDVTRDGASVLTWDEPAAEREREVADSTLTQSFWVKPGDDVRLPEQTVRGATLGGQRWVTLPPRGERVNGPGFSTRPPGFAVVGISVGRNGVVVMQRAADMIAAALVWESPTPIDDWTHVTVAHRDGVPHLFVDGRPVHRGVRTGKRLIAGDESTAEGTDSGSPFESAVRDLRTTWRALTDAQIATLPKDGPAEPARVEVVRDAAGSWSVEADRAGTYEVRLADGRTLSATVRAATDDVAIDGPWSVTFDGPAAPAATRWDRLASWHEAADDATKFFSGSATYETTLDLPADFDAGRTSCVLDLGGVAHVARVEVNGRPAGAALRPPHRLDVGGRLAAGTNTIRVRVTSDWANQMVGDERWPDDLADHRAENGNLNRWPAWALDGSPRPEPRRVTLSSRRFVTKETPLRAAGLIGPVRLSLTRRVELK